MKMPRFRFVGAFLAAILPAVLGNGPAEAVWPGVIGDDPLSAAELSQLDALAATAPKSPALPVFPTSHVRLPDAGDRNLYGVKLTPDLAQARQAYLTGQSDVAEEKLALAEQTAGSDKTALWYVASLRAQVLMALGQPSTTETVLARLEERETALAGTNVSTRSLRGEFNVWMNRFPEARNDLGKVILAIGNWRMPTSFMAPPADLFGLINTTRAQLRAMSALAVASLLERDFGNALRWASLAEQRYADLASVIDHPFYGMFIPADEEAVYGRAINLAVLGAAMLARNEPAVTAIPYFEAARAFLDSVGFEGAKLTIGAMESFALFSSGALEEGNASAVPVAEAASARGHASLVWQVELLRGQALIGLDRKAEAEAALRRAQAAIEVISGGLAGDSAKRHFAFGKEDVAYYLARLDAEKADLARLFEDMERARARAFVDMLAGRAVAAGRETEAVADIRALDHRLRRSRLAATSPLGPGSSEIEALLQQRISAVAALRTRDTELADVLAVSMVHLADVQDRLQPGDVLAYSLPARSEDLIRLLLVTRDGARLKELRTRHGDLRQLHERLREAMFVMPDVKRQAAIVHDISAALELGAWGARKALFVVPTNELYFVPWGALEIDVPVAVLPTGGWVGRTPPALADGRTAAVVGDPELFGAMPQLPGARKEAMMVAKLLNQSALIGEAATEEALRMQVGGSVRILHLATHGLFNDSQPLESAVMLSGSGKAIALTAAKLFEQPLPARIVVLSACETGLGHAIAGDDFLGLARSFYLGGTLVVLNSLWPIEDEGTQRFMTLFHERARSGDIGSAWLAARDRLKAEGYPPMVYGAFVIGGSLRPM